MEVQLFGPMQISSACAPPMSDIGAQGPGLACMQVPGGDEAAAPQLAPGMLALDDAGPFTFQPGEMLRGEVMGFDGGSVTLRFGDSTLGATTDVPLQQGQHVDLQVAGQQDGKWTLQVVGSQLFSAMTEEDVSAALLQMDLPVTESHVEVAKAMVSMGLPLGGEDIQQLTQSLSQLPREATPKDVLCAVFLRAGSLPVTATGVQLLASFITEHPFIGAQLLSLQGALRRLVRDESERTTMSDGLVQMLEEAPTVLGELVLEPHRASTRKTQRRLQDMAFQVGIESMGPHAGDDFDMQQWLQGLRERLQRQAGASAEQATALLADLEDGLAAMRLMNSAVTAEQGSFYLQIPLTPSQQTAEARILYHVDSQGRPVVDDDNVVIELRIPTETLDVVTWHITVSGGCATFDVAVDSEAARLALAEHLHVLMARVEALGYTVVTPVFHALEKREDAEQAGLTRVRVPVQSFDRLERVDIQA